MPPRSPLPRRHGLDAAWLRTPRETGWTMLRDHLVERIPRLSPERIDQMLAEGRFVDDTGQPIDATTPYRPHTFVWFHRDLPDEVPVPFEMEVLHRDERIVVIDKPHFLSTIPRGRHIQQSVVVRARQQLDLPELAPAHRLDRITAGVLLMTTEQRWRGPYQGVFEHRRATKVYEVIAGLRPELRFPQVVRSHIVKERGVLQAYEVADAEPNAETLVELLEERDGIGRYRATPHTGKTHQIRLHLLRLGLPIINDPFYPELREVPIADFSTPLQLLARELSFIDPITGDDQHFVSRRTLDAWPRRSPRPAPRVPCSTVTRPMWSDGGVTEPMVTESVNPDTTLIDELSTIEQIRLMNAQDAGVAGAVGAQAEPIARTVDAVAERMARGGRLLYVGAGTAGRLGVLDASEIPPTFGMDPTRVVGLIAGGERAIQHAVENAEDDAAQGAADLDAIHLTADDAVVGIAASGRTPYVIGALQHAREVGAFTAGLSCNPDSMVAAAAEVGIEVVVGPELITGSTRLKSGTAQKLVLNMISTLTMIKLGKTYGNLMVDVRATNEKLHRRSERLVSIATGVDMAEARTALDACGGSVKTAIAMVLTGSSADEAQALLNEHGGFLKPAVAARVGSPS